MKEQTSNTIKIHAMLINAGVRPAASIMVRNEETDDCRISIEIEGLNMISNLRGKTHATIYMFKYPCMKNVINFTLDKSYNRKALIQWIEGKMFGYSDEEINGYIK